MLRFFLSRFRRQRPIAQIPLTGRVRAHVSAHPDHDGRIIAMDTPSGTIVDITKLREILSQE